MPPVAYGPGQTPPAKPEDWAFLGHLTLEQYNRLQEFRKVLQASSITKDTLATLEDVQLLRFLRARDFNLKKALKFAEEDSEWRRGIAGRHLTKASFPTILGFVRNKVVRLCGKDKDGRPILVLHFGAVLPREIKDVLEVVNFFIFYVEHVKKFVDECGFTEFTAIADMANWSISENFSLPIAQVLVGLLQDHYPECLRYAFVVNNPWAFSAAWALLQPFLEDRLKAKIHVWGKRVDKIQEYVDKDVLETALGGTHPEYPAVDFVTAAVEHDNMTAIVGEHPYQPIRLVASSGMPTPLSPKLPLASSSVRSMPSPSSAGVDGHQPLSPGNPAGSSRRRWLVRMLSRRSPSDEALSSKPSLAKKYSSSAGEENRPMEVYVRARPRVGVFGGTGKTGKLVVAALLDKGVDVTIFVRLHGSGLAPDILQRAAEKSSDARRARLNIVVGELSNAVDVQRVTEDCDAVVCLLGVGSGGAEYLPQALGAIMDAMQAMNVRRLVVVSNAHASNDWWESGAGVLSNLNHSVFWRNTYSHLFAMENEVKVRAAQGVVDPTIVRPGVLVEGEDTAFNVREGFVFSESGPGQVSRAGLAAFVCEQAMDFKGASQWAGKGVAIGAR